MNLLRLNYLAGDRSRRRRNRQRLALLFIAIAIFASLPWWRPRATALWRRAEAAYLWRQCLQYTAPPDQVVYEEDSAAATALLKQDGYTRITRPSAFAAFPVAGYSPPYLKRLDAASGWNFVKPAKYATLFLHERKTPAGLRRLVVVQLDVGMLRAGDNAQFSIYAIDPDRVPPFQSVDGRNFGGTVRFDLHGVPYTDLRVFAGQPDPADATHLTIDYVLHGKNGTLQFWLLDSKPRRLPPGFIPTTCPPPEIMFNVSGFQR